MRMYMLAHRTCDLHLTQYRPFAHLLCFTLLWGLNFLPCVSFTAALPKPPVKLRASEITADSLKLTWEPGGMGPVLSYTILYKPKHLTGNYTKIINIRHQEYTIDRLQAYTHYEFRVLASNNLGDGVPSSPIEVVTGESVPFQPRNLQAIAVSPDEIEITWDSPQDARKIISYVLYYNESKQRLHGEITINPPSTKFKLTDLTANTVYHIQLSARSVTGEGVKTPTIQVKTLQFVPSAPPQAVSGKPINYRSIEVTWKPPPPDQQNGRIIGYKILYVENSTRSTEQDTKVEDVDGEARSVLLQSLSTWTAYKIWVLAYTSVGDGPLSHPIVVRTDENVPGDPKRVKVEAVNSTTIFVEWHPPRTQERNGIIRGYYVYYVEVDTNDDPVPSTEKRFDTENGNNMDAVIVNLKPDTRYHVQVAGYTRRGDGIRSKPKTVTTKGAVPSAPTNLQAKLIQAEPPQVHLSWNRPEEIHGSLEGYKLYWGRIGELYRQIILQANMQSYNATLLDRGATYEFRVLARNQVDYGERAVTTIDTPDGRINASYSCPTGFELHGHRCYIASGLEASWPEAKGYCKILGGKLAAIASDYEQTIIAGIITKMHGKISNEFYWLDGSNMLVEKEWRWMGNHGASVPFSYTNWQHGKPNYANEHCLELSYEWNYKWNNALCWLARSFICEARAYATEGKLVDDALQDP